MSAVRTGARSLVVTGVATALFFALGLVGVLHHEIWRDEAEIWLIARDSSSFSELLANMGTEAHPVLWYALNFLVARLTVNPLAMQLLNLLIGTAAALVFLQWAPFSRLQRVLFCFGYFPFYEFTVISRSYALQLLLTFGFCTLFARARGRWIVQAAVLVLLAQTHLYGTILAALLAALPAGEALRAARRAEPGAALRGSLASGAVLLSVAVATAHVLYQIDHIGAAHKPAVATWDLPWVVQSLATVYYGYLPVPNFFEASFWNGNILSLLPDGAGAALAAGLAPLLLAGSALMLARRRAALWIFLAGSAADLGITLFFFHGSLRHHGQIYLLFWTCYWLHHLPPQRGAEPRWSTVGSRVLTGFLVVQVVAGAWAYAEDLRHPFSRGRQVGSYLMRPALRDALVVGSFDYAAQSVAVFIDRPIYYPESKRFGTFLDWSDRRKPVREGVVLHDALDLMQEHDKPVVIVMNYEIPEPRLGQFLQLGPRARVECIARLADSIAEGESFFLYRVFDPTRSGALGPLRPEPAGRAP